MTGATRAGVPFLCSWRTAQQHLSEIKEAYVVVLPPPSVRGIRTERGNARSRNRQGCCEPSVYMSSEYVNDFNLIPRTNVPRDCASRDAISVGSKRTSPKPHTGAAVTVRHGNRPDPDHLPRDRRHRVVCSRAAQPQPRRGNQWQSSAGVSTGQAIAAMERIAGDKLPRGFGFQWTGL